MEGGSPTLISQRWTLPMYRAQLRYWRDHPRVETMIAAYLKIRPRYTPPPPPEDPETVDEVTTPSRPLDWSLLDDPPEEQARAQ